MGSWISKVFYGTNIDSEGNKIEETNQNEIKNEEKIEISINKENTEIILNNENNKSNENKNTKPVIDRSIFVQRNKNNEIIKRFPGQINGNQFICSKLINCQVIVLDFCDSMTFDFCEDSTFILSAIRGSIFIRDCKNCKFIMVCGQFRCKGCLDCDFFMHVKTGPVIETSQNLKIGCAEISYPELYEHMEKAKINPLFNYWTDIHDFSPGEGHFTYVSGEKLHLNELNEIESMLPFTYKKNLNLKHFNLLIPLKETFSFIKLTHNENIKIVFIEHIENSSNFSAEIEIDSVEEISNLFKNLKILKINN